MLLVMNVTLTNLVGMVYFTSAAPLSGPFCSAMVFGSNFFLTLGLLFLDTIVVLRYLYIFRWKTVGAVNDEVFAAFATVNNVVIAFLFATVRIKNKLKRKNSGGGLVAFSDYQYISPAQIILDLTSIASSTVLFGLLL